LKVCGKDIAFIILYPLFAVQGTSVNGL
jgi:hypothetical protein